MDPLEKLIPILEQSVQRGFFTSVRRWRDSVSYRALVDALKAGDVYAALRALSPIDAHFRPLGAAIEQGYETTGHDVTVEVLRQRPVGIRIAPVFDVRAPGADIWLRSHTADLIRQITADQRALIETALAPLRSGEDRLMTGETPEKIALDLVGRVNKHTGSREGGILGLTTQQAQWAANYETELDALDPKALTRNLRDKRFDGTIRKAIASGQPIPEDKRQAMVAAYRNRTLRYRAETISKNEADQVAIEAQQEAWKQAIGRGVVQADQLARYWLTVGDDRVRPTHAAIPGMNKAGVGLNEPFQTPKGPTLQPGWQFDAGCRCRVRIRVKKPAE